METPGNGPSVLCKLALFPVIGWLSSFVRRQAIHAILVASNPSNKIVIDEAIIISIILGSYVWNGYRCSYDMYTYHANDIRTCKFEAFLSF